MSQNTVNDSIDWKQRILDYRNSGLSLKAWCQHNDVKYSAMNYHLYATPKHKPKSTASPKMIPLIPVTKEVQKSNSIELVIGDATIKVDALSDMALLSEVIKVLTHD